MDLAVTILTQLVNWPLAGLVAWRAAQGRAPLAGWATVAILVVGAVAAWDPPSEQAFARVAVAVTNSALVLLFAVYPDGRFVPRWTMFVVAAEFAVQLGNLLSGLAWENQPWWPWHFPVTWGLLIIGGQIHRYRSRSSIDERERTRWPLLAIVVLILAFSLWSFLSLGLEAGASLGSATWFANFLFILPGVGFATGLLAPRILPVERVLHATLAWGLWAVLVTGAAWGLSVAFAALAPAARAWMTAVIAAGIAVPALWATRRLADLVVYGRRTDALRALDDLGGRLEASVDLQVVPSRIAETMTGSLGLAGAEVRGGTPALTASSGRAPDGGDSGLAEYPIRYQGELVATLVVLPRPGDAELTPHDRSVIEQICRQAAPALHGARVMTELIDARSRVVHAREEERKRLRRDLHDELAPTFAGLGLSAAAVEALSRVGDERASDAAAALVSGLHSATRQLRDVAYDLRPPVLDDRGLIAAIEDRVVIAGAVPTVRLEAPAARLDLPAAVELAALRIVQEAVMNVRRHAAAASCVVSVAIDGDDLALRIEDDGRGFAAGRRNGVGMRSMRERAEELSGTFHAGSARRGGAVIDVRLPLRARAAARSHDGSAVVR
ncbi:MAG: histidine kinase [Microbacterium sp.]